MKSWKIAALGAVTTLGLAAATSTAQRANQPSPAPPQQRQMDHSKSMDHQAMMNDPEMRRHMIEMMNSCSQMMQRMGNMPPMKGQ